MRHVDVDIWGQMVVGRHVDGRSLCGYPDQWYITYHRREGTMRPPRNIHALCVRLVTRLRKGILRSRPEHEWPPELEVDWGPVHYLWV